MCFQDIFYFFLFESQYHPSMYHWILIPDYNPPCCFFNWQCSILRSLVLRYAREVWSLKFPGSATKDGSVRLGRQEDPTILLNVSFHQFLSTCRQLMVKTVSEICTTINAFPTCCSTRGLLGYLGSILWLALFSTCLPAHHEHFCSMALPVLSFVSPLASVVTLQFSPNQSSVVCWVL